MLLGAARYLAETRNFAGQAVVIFQPAEEGGAGAVAMIKDGLMDRFGIEQVYGMTGGMVLDVALAVQVPIASTLVVRLFAAIISAEPEGA